MDCDATKHPRLTVQGNANALILVIFNIPHSASLLFDPEVFWSETDGKLTGI